LQDDEDSDEQESAFTGRADGVNKLKYSERVRVFNEIETMPSVFSSTTPEAILELIIKHVEIKLTEEEHDEALRIILRI